MAIAGLHNVSVLDSSFLRDSQSPVSRQWGNQERPSNQAFSVLQMWRELEGEQVLGHPQVAVGDRLRHWRNDGLNADLAGTYVSESQGSDNEDSLVDANEVQNGCRTWSQGQMDLQNEHEDSKENLRVCWNIGPVSDFPHRNRIQSSLKGRFLRSEVQFGTRDPLLWQQVNWVY
ncbi:hypothetical protein F0562_001978 [Nyssa sinensis]|uniref:Uncharacterized protein n=1 Tax=Nyssa sinensis TaxID=561372 RepID=A0A5J5C643_9ASTE|nr:hypothetical protein F0562_001978 [Nyssa sinensis]